MFWIDSCYCVVKSCGAPTTLDSYAGEAVLYNAYLAPPRGLTYNFFSSTVWPVDSSTCSKPRKSIGFMVYPSLEYVMRDRQGVKDAGFQ